MILRKNTKSIQVSMKLGGVYKSQQKPKNDDKGTGGPYDANPEKDNVVDADFEDVKEDKQKAPR